jgi:hypothetical protein
MWFVYGKRWFAAHDEAAGRLRPQPKGFFQESRFGRLRCGLLRLLL